MDFTGKAVLVTGSSTGIGRATAVEFAKKGACVGINYAHSETSARETLRLVEAAGGKGVIFKADVSSSQEANDLVLNCHKEFGRLDVLVSNAAITEFIDFSDLDAVTPELWDKVLSTNLYGPFFCMRAAAKIMKEQGSGSIVTVSSVGGMNPYGSCIPYSVSKAGLLHLTRCMARILAPNIRVNCVIPASVSDSNWFANNGGGADGNVFQGAEERSPLKRNGESLDYARAIVFLASEDASYCTGTSLLVDGGGNLC